MLLPERNHDICCDQYTLLHSFVLVRVVRGLGISVAATVQSLVFRPCPIMLKILRMLPFPLTLMEPINIVFASFCCVHLFKGRF